MRNFFLIGGAVVLTAIAVAVLAWTGLVEIPLFAPSEKSLMEQMSKVADSGGIAATFSEQDSKSWKLPDGHKLERFGADESGYVFARLTSSGPVDNSIPDWSTRGLSLDLPLALTNMAQGKRLEIGIVARSSQANPSKSLLAVFATQQAGNSGWHELEVHAGFDMLKFTYDVPAPDGGYTKSPILVLHSDASGRGGSVELLGVYTKIVPKDD